MSDKRYAEMAGHRVEILAGPEKCDISGEIYWVRGNGGSTFEARAENLTFPPHAERTVLLYRYGSDIIQSVLLRSGVTAEDIKKQFSNPLSASRHWQQNEGDEWQVERIELDA